MRNFDLVNTMQSGESVVPAVYTSTQTGTGIDCKNCGPEIGVLVPVGAVSGTNPTLTVTLQESDASGSGYANIANPISLACNTAATLYSAMAISRQHRYVRAIATLGGTSPSFAFAVLLLLDIHSMDASYGSGNQ